MNFSQSVVSSSVSSSVSASSLSIAGTNASNHALHAYSQSQSHRAIIRIGNSAQCPPGTMRMAEECGSNFTATDRNYRSGLVPQNAAQASAQARNRSSNRYKGVGSIGPGAASPGHSHRESATRPTAAICATYDLVARQSAADQLSSILGPVFHVGVEFSRNSAMLIAAAKGNVQLIELLLAVGASVEARDAWGRTPLMVATVSRSRAAMELLHSAGADLNALDALRNTPMMYAAKMDDAVQIYTLRRAGVDVDARNQCGNTALIFAIEQNNLLAVQALLDKHIEGSVVANPVAWNTRGTAPLFFAMAARVQISSSARSKLESAGNPWQTAALFSDWKEVVRKNATIIAALLDVGVDVDTRDNKGNTLQTYAVIMHDVELIAMLREAGADPELQNTDGKSAMTYARDSGVPLLLNTLLNHGYA